METRLVPIGRVCDLRDRLIMLLVTGAWVASTVYLFKFHSDTNFGIWAGLCGTMTGFYHFMTVRDDKIPDSTQ